MKKSAVLSSLALTALVLNGCGGSLESTTSLPQGNSSSSNSSSSSSATASASSDSASPSPSTETSSASSSAESSSPAPSPSTSSETSSAPSDPVQEALQSGLAGFVSEDQRGNWSAVDGTSSFNADKDLSYIQVRNNDGSYALMLFHNGQYIGNSMSRTYTSPASIERGADDALIVNYSWPKDGESSSNATGKTVSVLSWDSSANTFKNTGNIPTEHYETVADARKDVPAIYPSAAQGVPSGANKLGDRGSVKSPSGKITCTVDAQTVTCNNATFESDGTYGGGLAAVAMTNNSETAHLTSSTSASGYDNKGTVVYGTQVVLGDYIFAMNESGMTVWSSSTGKGFYINRDTYHTFG